jgi:hypothetical protein
MFGGKRRREARLEAEQTPDLREFLESMVDSDLTLDEINDNFVRHLVERGWAEPIGGGQFRMTISEEAARVGGAAW